MINKNKRNRVKRNARVVKIMGFKGLFLAMFAIVCLFAGFVCFPAMVAMKIWNAASFLPQINMLQGGLLWAIVAISVYLLNNNRLLISFDNVPVAEELNDAEMNKLLERVRMHREARNLNAKIFTPEEFLKQDFNSDNIREILSDKTEQTEESREEIKK